MRSQEVVEQELRDMETELEQIKEQLELLRRQMLTEQAQEALYSSVYGDKINKEQKIRLLQSELDLIRANVRNEVSCIAFHPKSVNQNTSYIAVGVNNDIAPKNNRISMYAFSIEPSFSEKEYSLPL